MSLQLVHSSKVACWPWSLRWIARAPVRAATCRHCERDIAQPTSRARDVPVCIYCALDSGLIPTEDGPIWMTIGGEHEP